MAEEEEESRGQEAAVQIATGLVFFLFKGNK